MTVDNPDPTPQELVDQLARYHGKSAVKYDRVMRRAIRDAERLGQAHQRAVSQFIAELAGVPPTKNVGEPWTAGADRVTLDLVVKVDDRWFQARDTVDYYMWTMHFENDIVAWERFLNNFVRQSVGGLANDPQQYTHFRRRLHVVTPQDRHSSRLCRASNDTALSTGLTPRCYSGVVRRDRPAYSGLFGLVPGTTPLWDLTQYTDGRSLGRCTCRCHRHPLSSNDPEYHIGPRTTYDDRGFVR